MGRAPVREALACRLGQIETRLQRVLAALHLARQDDTVADSLYRYNLRKAAWGPRPDCLPRPQGRCRGGRVRKVRCGRDGGQRRGDLPAHGKPRPA